MKYNDERHYQRTCRDGVSLSSLYHATPLLEKIRRSRTLNLPAAAPASTLPTWYPLIDRSSKSDRIPAAFLDDDGGTVAAFGGYFPVSVLPRSPFRTDSVKSRYKLKKTFTHYKERSQAGSPPTYGTCGRGFSLPFAQACVVSARHDPHCMSCQLLLLLHTAGFFPSAVALQNTYIRQTFRNM